MKRVWLFPADDGMCGHVRLLWPAQLMTRLGLPVSVRWDHRINLRRDGDRWTVAGVEGGELPDVVVMQRCMSRAHYETALAYRNAGIRVVLDWDDDLTTLPAEHPLHERLGPEMGVKWARDTCRVADRVTVSTPRLRGVWLDCRGRKAHLRRNALPPALFDRTRPARIGLPTLGWGGSATVHAWDLPVAAPTVQALRGEGLCKTMVVGDKEGRDLLDPEAELVGWQPLGSAYYETLERFDVGIAPLADVPFNHWGKSALKPLELGALGIPCVGSPSDEYRRLARAGGVVLADSPAQWRDRLTELLTDRSRRTDVGARAREAAKGSMLTASDAEDLYKVWCGE